MSAADTIFALASARGRAGVSVIRLSGPDALKIGVEISGPLDESRLAHLRSFKNPKTDEVIDRGLVMSFKDGASFTGEPVVELQCHGSVSVVDAILSILGDFDRCRLAEPGEFTKRALLNGKMDLVEVEGLADLIEAETEEQRRQANRMMSGDLREKADVWTRKLLKLNALLEASIDFADEELPDELLANLGSDISELLKSLRSEIEGSRGNEIIRNGFTVAIVGKPNVGKSTLLNTLTGREAAIASEIAGTTRDVIEVRLNLGGIPVILLDTAGLHDSDDEVEKIGIDRARQRAADADLRLFLIEDEGDLKGLDVSLEPGDLVVLSKSDLKSNLTGLGVSSKTGQGVTDLIAEIEGVLAKRTGPSSSLVRQRHIDTASAACFALEAALDLLAIDNYDIELVSERVREAVSHLDHLVGKFNVEAVLGEIFSNFCIGK